MGIDNQQISWTLTAIDRAFNAAMLDAISPAVRGFSGSPTRPDVADALKKVKVA